MTSEANIGVKIVSGFDKDKSTDAILTIEDIGINLHWKGTFTGRDKGDQFLRYEDITSIGFKKGILLGQIVINFSGGKFKIDNITKSIGPIFVSNVQKRIEDARKAKNDPQNIVSPMDEIKKAKELLDIGAITEDEFNAIKNKYLNT